MWERLATKLAVWLLKNGRLGNENRQILTAALLNRLGALPLRARIVIDGTGKVLVDGKGLNLETAKHLQESSRALLKNFARKFVGEQVTFMAVTKGVHENVSPEQGLFAKAALWVHQEEDELYRLLAQSEGIED